MDKMHLTIDTLQASLLTLHAHLESCKEEGFMYSPDPLNEANNMQKVHTDLDVFHATLRILNNVYGWGYAPDAERIKQIAEEIKQAVRHQYHEAKANS